MAQPVAAILSRQGELAARARKFTEGANEASLLVGRVVSRALLTRERGEAEDIVLSTMSRDLDRMIEQLRSAQL
ncbi:MAG: hypothetical protein HY054_01890 [Proteobacteria bacterium]|nr:hypothetical protein [Pseudomonadota bacterium]